jgi:hypothetical protein
MKRARSIFLIMGLATIFITTICQAPPQNDPSRLYLMGDFLVDASRAGDYEAALKELISHLKKHAFPLLFDTYVTDDSHYFVVYGLKDAADIDRWKKAWRELAQRMGPETLPAVQLRIVAAELERVYQLWYFRPDISFLPEKERLRPEEIGHYTWDYVWVIPGKEAEFEALNKEWIALSKAKNARDPFMTYVGDLGTQMPVYVWFEYGKSPADYAAAEERFWKIMGAEGADLSKRTRALIRRMESKTGRYRSDLSFAPER